MKYLLDLVCECCETASKCALGCLLIGIMAAGVICVAMIALNHLGIEIP